MSTRLFTLLSVTFLLLLAKNAQSQVVDWAQPSGSQWYYTSYFWDSHLSTTDHNGNLVRIYRFSDSCHIGDSLFLQSGSHSIVAGTSPQRKVLWTIDFSGFFTDRIWSSDYHDCTPHSIACDSNGFIYMMILFSDSVIHYGNTTLRGRRGQLNRAVLKVGSDGTLFWSQSLGAQPFLSSTTWWYSLYASIEVEPSGGSYALFEARDSVSIGTSQFSSLHRWFTTLVHLSATGQVLWTRMFDLSDTLHVGSYYSSENRLAAMRSGGCVTVIPHFDTLRIDTTLFPGLSETTARITSTNSIAWAVNALDEYYYYSFGLGVDANSNVYRLIEPSPSTIAQYQLSPGRFAIHKLNTTGKTVWVRSSTSMYHAAWVTYHLGVTPAGDIIVGGYLDTAGLAPFFGKDTVTRIGIAQYTSDGDLQWAAPVASKGAYPGSVLASGKGHIYMDGVFNDSTTLGPDAIRVAHSLGAYSYVLHMTKPTFYTDAPLDTEYCLGDSIQVPFRISPRMYGGNSFVAEVSDSAGSFTNAKVIGTRTGVNDSLPVPSRLPFSLAAGKHYRLRVRSTKPTLFGAALGPQFRLKPLPAIRARSRKGTDICVGASADLFATGGIAYRWSTGDTASAIAVDSAGLYTVVGIDSNGCSNFDTIRVRVHSAPAIVITALGTTTICDGDSLRLTAKGGRYYLWSSGDTGSIAYAKIAGDYWVTATDSFGCAGTSQTIHVKVLPSPQKPSITANGKTLISSADSNNQWYYEDIKLGGAKDKTLQASADGKYYVVVTGPNGCTRRSDPFSYVRKDPSDVALDAATTLEMNVSAEEGISYTIPNAGVVRLEIYDLLGNRIAKLVDGLQSAGSYHHQLPAHSITSSYLVRLQFNDKPITRKISY